jgi:hypothetical protein
MLSNTRPVSPPSSPFSVSSFSDLSSISSSATGNGRLQTKRSTRLSHTGCYHTGCARDLRASHTLGWLKFGARLFRLVKPKKSCTELDKENEHFPYFPPYFPLSTLLPYSPLPVPSLRPYFPLSPLSLMCVYYQSKKRLVNNFTCLFSTFIPQLHTAGEDVREVFGRQDGHHQNKDEWRTVGRARASAGEV